MAPNRNTILFVIPTAYPLGGVAVWLDYLIPGLSQKGWDCIVGLVDGEYHQAKSYLDQHPFKKIIKLKNSTATRYGRIQAIKKAAIKVDANIIVSVNIPDVFEAVAQLKLAGKKVKSVMTLHGLEADYFIDIRAMKDQIDALVVTNKLTKAMVLTHSGYEAERTFYAPYGVVVGEHLDTKKISKPLVITYAGRLDQTQKRCLDLVDFVKNLEKNNCDYVLQIVGDGKLGKELVSQLIEQAQQGEVSYLGEVSNQELTQNLFPKTDVLILTSSWETGPIVVWEAMAKGVVVLSSRYIGSGLEAALTDQKNCLMFHIGDMQEAVNQLEKLNDIQKISNLQRQGFELVSSRFSHASSISSWDQVFDGVLNKVEAKPPVSLSKQWQAKGRIEKLLGDAIGYQVRRLTRMQAFVESAGDEWPHSYGSVSEEENRQFEQALNSLESYSRVEN